MPLLLVRLLAFRPYFPFLLSPRASATGLLATDIVASGALPLLLCASRRGLPLPCPC